MDYHKVSRYKTAKVIQTLIISLILEKIYISNLRFRIIHAKTGNWETYEPFVIVTLHWLNQITWVCFHKPVFNDEN